ncbi:MAG: UvrD-helicase domain-containing protein [Bacilli bacterium]|nr:UvrD-helicase domain-containing protein [Bacilli bacterium]
MSEELYNYFKNMFIDVDSNIILDEDQMRAVMCDDAAVLILAGAGTGKTTTMVAKVKYLVDIKKIDPNQILIISYTRKAVDELRDIINEKFQIPSKVTTFHSLAYQYIRELFRNRKCEVVDYNFREKVFYDYINDLFRTKRISSLVEVFNKDTLSDIPFFYGKYFLKHYLEFSDYDSFFESYRNYKMEEARKIGFQKVVEDWISSRYKSDREILTLKGDYVKSIGEAVIANYLFRKGVVYHYEKIYKDLMEDRHIYKPDFTMEVGQTTIYLEYFGMNDLTYDEIKRKKINYHLKHHNMFIYIDKMPVDKIEKVLEEKLSYYPIIFQELSMEDVYSYILNLNKLSQIYPLKNLFFDTISKIKENVNRDYYQEIIEREILSLPDNEKKNSILQYHFIQDFYLYYSSRLYRTDIYSFDFSDLLYYVNKYIVDRRYLNGISKYQYIIIDEYQDISDGEYHLARNTANRCSSRIFAVGDDWQSIYSFRGSNISYITEFQQYFFNPTILSIRKTYRNSQELVDIAGQFIKRNPNQIDKDLISFKHLKKPVHFMMFDDRVGNFIDPSVEYFNLKRLILMIHEVVPNHSILILGRNNQMIQNCFHYDDTFKEELGTKIKILDVSNLEVDGMTIHKSKGLTYDEVILIGMNQKFPSSTHHDFWITHLFKSKILEEGIPFPEERRLFYVALTRTRNNVFIMTNKNKEHRSLFVDELMNICKNLND